MPEPRTARRKLRNLRITNVDVVPLGANQDASTGEGAHIALWKSAGTVDKRPFSTDERGRAAGTGAAMPDGSFPIKNRQDLLNAIRAVGRAKDPAAARRHIAGRARSLGLTSLLPDGWATSKGGDASVSDDSSRGAGPQDDEGGRRMPQGRNEGDQGRVQQTGQGQSGGQSEQRFTEAEWRERERRSGSGDNQGRENAVEEAVGGGLDDLDEGTRQREVRERTGQSGSQATGREGDELPGQHGRDDTGSPGGRTTGVDPSQNPGLQSEDPKKMATLEARLAESEARSARLEKAWNERQAAEMERVFKGRAESFGSLGDVDTLAAILKACAGASKELYEKAEQALQVAAARVEGSVVSGGLFAEVGTTKGDATGATGDDAIRFGSEAGELMQKARQIAEKEQITVEAATVVAVERFPNLYGEFLKSQTAPRR